MARLLPEFCLRHNISKVEVLGSVANNRTREGSDLDLLVTFRPGVRQGLEFFAILDSANAIGRYLAECDREAFLRDD